MAANELWYDRQANISKLITYAAILILLASLASAATVAYTFHEQLQKIENVLVIATLVVGGTFLAAFLVGISAIIDLMIVHAEALRGTGSRRN